MKTSADTDKIDAAILGVQREAALVNRNKNVEVEGKTSKFASRYVTIAALYKPIRDLLTKYGISFTQHGHFDDKGGERLVTRLACDGQWIASSFPIRARDGAQNFGGGIAFARRWGLACALGIITDDDGDEAHGYNAARNDVRAAKRAPAPAGIAAALEAIRVEGTHEGLVNAARRARAAHPQGEGATQVERVIADWFVDAAERCATLDDLTALRDVANTVKPRGNDAREAIGKAARRLEP